MARTAAALAGVKARYRQLAAGKAAARLFPSAPHPIVVTYVIVNEWVVGTGANRELAAVPTGRDVHCRVFQESAARPFPA